MRGLAGRSVLVSGGTRGIGLATAARFLDEGARVRICGPDADELADAAGLLARLGEVTAARCDVSDVGDVERTVAEAEAWGHGIDVLINNAGIARRDAFLDIAIEDWDHIIAVNLRGMFLMAQQVARTMVRRRRGVIVNMASTNALGGEALYAHYNASKGGVVQLTRTMAVELAPAGIRVNALCPGYIDTPLNTGIAADSAESDFAERYVRDHVPLGRVGTADDVAAAYAFLASDDAAFITGAVLVVDGGQTAVM